MLTLAVANMTLAAALRAGGDEVGATAAVHEAQDVATAKQDVVALRKIAAFLASEG